MSTTSVQLTVPDLCNAQALQRFSSVQPGSGAAVTTDIYTASGAATCVEFAARVTGSVATGDWAIQVSLQKKVGSVVITDVIVLDSTSILGVWQTGAFLIGGLNAGDIVQLHVTTSGTVGDQATGLQVNYSFFEVL